MVPFLLVLLALPFGIRIYASWTEFMRTGHFSGNYYYLELAGYIVFGALLYAGIRFLRGRWYGYLVAVVWYGLTLISPFTSDLGLSRVLSQAPVPTIFISISLGALLISLVLEAARIVLEKNKHNRKTNL